MGATTTAYLSVGNSNTLAMVWTNTVYMRFLLSNNAHWISKLNMIFSFIKCFANEKWTYGLWHKPNLIRCHTPLRWMPVVFRLLLYLLMYYVNAIKSFGNRDCVKIVQFGRCVCFQQFEYQPIVWMRKRKIVFSRKFKIISEDFFSLPVYRQIIRLGSEIFAFNMFCI